MLCPVNSSLFKGGAATSAFDDEEFSGPLFGIDYFAWMECSIFARFLCSLLICVLVMFLMSTADEYLTGTLSVICHLMKMSQEVAGATLLALGNGAPDVFSTLAALTKGTTSHTDLALGSLLGASMFVLTVILGSVILVSAAASKENYIQVQRETFGRDVVFVILALCLLLLVHFTNVGAHLLVGIGFILTYVLYVCFIFLQSRRAFRPERDVKDLRIDDLEEVEPLVSSELKEPIHFVESHFVLPATATTAALPSTSQPVSTASSLLMRGLYWKQLKARNQLALFGKQSMAGWYELNYLLRLLKLCGAPLEVARALTVPIPEPTSWNRNLVLLHPTCCSLFLFAIFPPLRASAPIVVAICGLVLTSTIYVYFCVHDAVAPRHRIVQLLLVAVSFIMCVLWIYTVASEIVCLLNAFGRVFNVNASIMGLSLLAWGNSIGDLVTNISIARSGLSGMAISACIAGPVFQLLFGFGISLVAVAIKYYPATVPIQMDHFTLPVCLLIIAVMSASLAVVHIWAQYRLSKCLGVFLCLAYVVYVLLIGLRIAL